MTHNVRYNDEKPQKKKIEIKSLWSVSGLRMQRRRSMKKNFIYYLSSCLSPTDDENMQMKLVSSRLFIYMRNACK